MRLIPRAITGAIGGLVGTAAMDALWYARYRKGGGKNGPLEWEFGGDSDWADVSAPGKVGQLALTTVTGVTPPESWAVPTRNAVHLITGVGWGKVYAILTPGRGSWARGLALGAVAWLTSYAILPKLGIYKPLHEEDPRVLAQDLTAHLVFGVTTAATIATIRKPPRAVKGDETP